MNAVDFVRKLGVEEAIKVINLFPNSTLINIDGSCVSVSDLKQIVDAFELVESYGSLANAKNRCYPAKFVELSNYNALKQAINLMEQCNA